MITGARTLRITIEEVLAATGGTLLRVSESVRVLEGVSTDSRVAQAGGLFIGIPGERFDGSDYAPQAAGNGAACVLVSRGKGASLRTQLPQAAIIETESTVRAYGLLARWHRRRMPARIVAVTGSNGKTTTKEMIASVLSQGGATLATEGNLNNEIGAPQTLLRLRPEHRYAVIELGMNHEGEIGRLTAMTEPHIGVVTLAAAVHTENLGGIEGVSHAKAELYHGLSLDGVVVANADDALMAQRARSAGRRTIWFGRAEQADVRLLKITTHDARGIGCVVRFDRQDHVLQLPVVGLHNAMNACAAIAACTVLDASVESIVSGLARARPPGRRLRLSSIPESDATLLDDCYNANPASTIAALATLKELAPAGHRIAVLGDMRELGNEAAAGHRDVGIEAARSGVKLLVAFGTEARDIADGARQAGLDAARIFQTTDPAEAAARVRSVIEPKDLVLVKASRGTRLERVSDLLAPPSREELH